jgi:hypothetical protein
MKYVVAISLIVSSLVGACDQNRDAPVSAARSALSSADGGAKPKAHCCAVTNVFNNSTSKCRALSSPTTINCDDRNPWLAARWTCGTAAAMCTDNGRSCAVGDPCTLAQDSSCVGVVQECSYPWYDSK